MIVLTPKDRVLVTLTEYPELKFWISPLTYQQRAELASLKEGIKDGIDAKKSLELAYKSLKFALKEVEGVKLLDGKNFKLRLDDNDEVNHEDLEAFLSMTPAFHVAMFTAQLENGFQSYDINGVEVHMDTHKTVKKKSSKKKVPTSTE